MRIIAGTAKGLKLKAPRGDAVRPTADKVKEALFSILGPKVIGAVAADLFAGSGALGIEALSRGADLCIFVDISKKHLAITGDNLKRAGLNARSRLLGMSAVDALKLISGGHLQLDLIFIDPPYHSNLVPKTLQIIRELRLLKDDGLIVVEHPVQSAAWTEIYPACKQKKYGAAGLSFISREELFAPPADKAHRTNSPDDI